VRTELLDAGIGKPKKFFVVPPGLSLGDLIPKEVARKEFELDSPDLVCGLVGRVTQIKRPDRFLDVVKELKIRGRAIQFIVAGDGELLQECGKRVLEENLPVTFLGWQNDISKVFSALDLLILTSDNEGTPLSLIQAGLARLPVVSTNVGSILEVVQNGKTGFVTDKSVTSLTDAIEKLLFDPGLRQVIGNAAYEFTTNNFGVKRLVDDYQKLYLDSLI
jgi:glycosyltransferase involved in cell wall biosynthesis